MSTWRRSWRFAPGMVARKPDHQGEREAAVKTIVQGRPDQSGEPVVTNSYAFYSCMRGCGCIGYPAFPAPSLFEGRCMYHSGTSCRGKVMHARIVAPRVHGPRLKLLEPRVWTLSRPANWLGRAVCRRCRRRFRRASAGSTEPLSYRGSHRPRSRRPRGLRRS